MEKRNVKVGTEGLKSKKKGLQLMEILFILGVIFVLIGVVSVYVMKGNKSVVAAKDTTIEDQRVGDIVDNPSETFKKMAEGSVGTESTGTGTGN
jgi:hypothetical protein